MPTLEQSQSSWPTCLMGHWILDSLEFFDLVHLTPTDLQLCCSTPVSELFENIAPISRILFSSFVMHH